jgi:hypothetical protein
MRLDYTLGGNGYAGVIHALPTPQNWGGAGSLQLWAKSDGSTGRNLTVQFVAGGLYWETSVPLTGDTGKTVTIPLSGFQNPPWANKGALDLSGMTQIAFYVGGTTGSGTLSVDSITAGK